MAGTREDEKSHVALAPHLWLIVDAGLDLSPYSAVCKAAVRVEPFCETFLPFCL